MLVCPNCREKQIGKLSPTSYYCWVCSIELTVSGNELHIHQVEADGTLSSLDDLFSKEERRLL